MNVFKSISETLTYRIALTAKDMSVGFVPTMGALHSGHLSLVKRAKEENNVVVVSIFVNPIQFNDPGDLQKYPRNLERDLDLLSEYLTDDDFVFAPTKEEMYPESIEKIYDFGSIAKVMEGSSREGHFNGVGIVVNRLFRIVEPHKAYFGKKDYQQLAIIRKMVEIEELPVTVIGCSIIREKGGLAMSSRNQLLNASERERASVLYETLVLASTLRKNHSLREVKELMTKRIESSPGFKVEYVEIADEESLQALTNWDETDHIRCFLAVKVGKVRLIDNLKIVL